MAALATNASESAPAHMGLGHVDEAQSPLERAEQHLIAMRQEGYFEPSMWRERQVARDAQTMAERLIRSSKGDRAREFLRVSVRLLQVRYHRPAAVRVVNADFIRHHALMARACRQANDLIRRTSDSYLDAARRLGVSENVVAVTVFSLRRRYRELARKAIADTLSNPTDDDIEAEWQELLRLLGA